MVPPPHRRQRLLKPLVHRGGRRALPVLVALARVRVRVVTRLLLLAVAVLEDPPQLGVGLEGVVVLQQTLGGVGSALGGKSMNE